MIPRCRPHARQTGERTSRPLMCRLFKASCCTSWHELSRPRIFWKSALSVDTAPSGWHALLPGGRLITLEANPKHAAVARSNLEKAGLADVAEVRLGRAADTLRQLEAEGRGPFDLIFLDADKPSNAEYLGWAVRLGRPGTVIICDNVVRDGAVIDSTTTDPNVQGSRRFLDVLAAEPRVIATALQTVGWKGYDGFAIGVVGQR